MNLNERTVGEVTVIEIAGRIDSVQSPKLHERAAALVTEGRPAILLDLSKVEYISSAGFRVLLLLARQAGQGKSRLILCGLSPKVRQLFDLGGFLDLFPISSTQEEGIAAAG
jgi:anti-anti-sigma factor